MADALRKLGGMEGSGSTATVGAVQAPAQLPDLFGAVLEHHRIAFGYGAAGVVRHLEPHRLQYERGRWYVSGLDTDRDGLRSFRVDRFHGAVEVDLESSFAPPGDLPDVRLRPWEFGTSEPVAARLLLDGPIARAVLAEDPGPGGRGGTGRRLGGGPPARSATPPGCGVRAVVAGTGRAARPARAPGGPGVVAGVGPRPGGPGRTDEPGHRGGAGGDGSCRSCPWIVEDAGRDGDRGLRAVPALRTRA